jgi:hypothetical protein
MFNLNITKKETQMILLLGAVIIYLHPTIILFLLLGYYLYTEMERNNQIRKDAELARRLGEEERKRDEAARKRREAERRRKEAERKRKKPNNNFYNNQNQELEKRFLQGRVRTERDVRNLIAKKQVLAGLQRMDQKILGGEETAFQKYGLKMKQGSKQMPRKLNGQKAYVRGSHDFFK